MLSKLLTRKDTGAQLRAVLDDFWLAIDVEKIASSASDPSRCDFSV
jgi:hypothetical protein